MLKISSGVEIAIDLYPQASQMKTRCDSASSALTEPQQEQSFPPPRLCPTNLSILEKFTFRKNIGELF
jgi:hypothetical protein